MKKITLLLILLLAACISGQISTETAEIIPTHEPAAVEERLILTVAGRADSIADSLSAVIPEWEKATGYEVRLLELPYAYLQEKVFTDVLTGLGNFDVVFIDDPWLPALAGGGHLVPWHSLAIVKTQILSAVRWMCHAGRRLMARSHQGNRRT